MTEQHFRKIIDPRHLWVRKVALDEPSFILATNGVE